MDIGMSPDGDQIFFVNKSFGHLTTKKLWSPILEIEGNQKIWSLISRIYNQQTYFNCYSNTNGLVAIEPLLVAILTPMV